IGSLSTRTPSQSKMTRPTARLGPGALFDTDAAFRSASVERTRENTRMRYLVLIPCLILLLFGSLAARAAVTAETVDVLAKQCRAVNPADRDLPLDRIGSPDAV